jgi:hypothetical protein
VGEEMAMIELLNWVYEIPKQTGWYWVKWNPNTQINRIYVWFCPKSDYPDDDDIGEEGFSTWGVRDTDDPEAFDDWDAGTAAFSFIGAGKV